MDVEEGQTRTVDEPLNLQSFRHDLSSLASPTLLTSQYSTVLCVKRTRWVSGDEGGA